MALRRCFSGILSGLFPLFAVASSAAVRLKTSGLEEFFFSAAIVIQRGFEGRKGILFPGNPAGAGGSRIISGGG